MAEAIGAVNGVASLFNTTLAWFEYVYIAKQTGSRLQSLILQLDNAQLRLSRWGEAAGLSGTHVEDEESASDSLVLNGEQKKIAIKTFNFICSSFEKSEKICHAFRKGKTEDDPKVKELETPLSRARWSPANKYLHETMRKIVEGRKNKIGVLRRAKFAIYDENHLKDLVKDINDHIDSLYKIFPLPDDAFSLDKQTQQTKHEMNELLSVMEMLGSTVQIRDKLLGSAIGVILNQKNNMSMVFDNDKSNIVIQGQMTGGTAEQSNTQNYGVGGG